MTADDLLAHIDAIGIGQADLARLVDVTPRAVSFWVKEGRDIPGPVQAYLRLLRSLPANLRAVELSRLKQGRNPMRQGMYSVEFTGGAGSGVGTLVVEDGRAYGYDPSGARYDGVYDHDDATGRTDLRLKVTFPADAMSVFGIAHPHEWAMDMSGSFDTRRDEGVARVETPLGHAVDVRYRFMRAMPEA